MEYVPTELGDLSELFQLHEEALGSYVNRIYGWDRETQRRLFAEKFDPTAVDWIVCGGERIGASPVLLRGGSQSPTSLSRH